MLCLSWRECKKKKIQFECAINADFVGPKFTGDDTRYIYLGSVGKLLPAFYIRGNETHVGQAFEGLDPNLLASELVRRIGLNTDLADVAEGEVTLPPCYIETKGFKTEYNVQTPISSFVYFNYFVHQISPEKILNQLSGIVEDAFNDVLKNLNEQYKKYSKKASFQFKSLPWESRVIAYAELYDKVYRLYGDKVHARLNRVLNQYADELDPREIGRLLIEELLLLDKDTSPVIVLFFAPPYVPKIFVKNRTHQERNILHNLHAVLENIEKTDNEKFEVNKFFPSLTDSSYLSLDDTDDEIEVLRRNFPKMESLYPVPIDKIRKLNIPALNIGTWGKDAHKKIERVYKPYTFGVLPRVIKTFCKNLLK